MGDEEEAGEGEDAEIPLVPSLMMSHQNLRMPGFATEEEMMEDTSPPKKRRRIRRTTEATVKLEGSDDDAEYGIPEEQDDESEDFLEEEDDIEIDAGRGANSNKRKAKTALRKEDFSSVDDGNEKKYQARLRQWIQGRRKAREKAQMNNAESAGEGVEWMRPHPTIPDDVLENGYRMPGDIYPSLFDYQKTCVQWLWELHQQNVGGIIGDEMGLGKTIQIISFLAGLHYSGKLTKPVLIVAPATVLKQWVNEFHKWWPPLRVPILHSSGSAMLNVNHEEDLEDMLEIGEEPTMNNRHGPAAERLVNRVFEKGSLRRHSSHGDSISRFC